MTNEEDFESGRIADDEVVLPDSRLTRAPSTRTVGLPMRPFFFTLDQLASMLDIKIGALRLHIYKVGRDEGLPPRNLMQAHDINEGTGGHADWRVSDQEFARWLRLKGFRVYDRGWVRPG